MRFYNAKTILTKPQPAYLVINIFSQQDSLFADVFFFRFICIFTSAHKGLGFRGWPGEREHVFLRFALVHSRV